jgi:hypothetical protein
MATKLRPYRVDYFDFEEINDYRVLVHSIIVRAVTAAEAKEYVNYENRLNRSVIRAYRFYKKLPKTSKPKYVALEDVLTPTKAQHIRDQYFDWLESLDKPFMTVAAPVPEPPSTGPESPETKAVVADLNSMLAHDDHEKMMDTFVPDTIPQGKRFPDLQNENIETSTVPAPSPFTFPNAPTGPVEDAVFTHPTPVAQKIDRLKPFYFWAGVGLIILILGIEYLLLFQSAHPK